MNEGFVIDGKGVAHEVYDRGPICYQTWCLRSVLGPAVQEISASTHRCHACRRAVDTAAAAERDAGLVQGWLF